MFTLLSVAIVFLSHKWSWNSIMQKRKKKKIRIAVLKPDFLELIQNFQQQFSISLSNEKTQTVTLVWDVLCSPLQEKKKKKRKK